MQLEFMSDVEIGDSELFVYFDQKGLEELRSALERAIRSGYDHLFAESWGGKELTVGSEGGRKSYKKVTLTFGK